MSMEMPAPDQHERFLRLAIDEGIRGANEGRGGPFGALVVRDGAILAAAHNQVTSCNDPTAHAEVQAIRIACAGLGSFQLTDCDVYASCEPCPMCLGALYWARPRAIYFAATREDAAAGGFDDAFIYDEISRPISQRRMAIKHVPLPRSDEPFHIWRSLSSRIRY